MALGFPWLGIGGYGYIHRKFPFYSGKLKTDGMKKQVGAVMDNPDGLFPAQGAYRKFPLSRYIKHRFKKIDAYICDELHEYSGESAQGEAMAEIAGIAKKVIAMTATLINGYAKGTFYLLFRLKPRLMLADGFKYSDARKFCQCYGVVESIYESPETKFNVASKNRTQKVREKFLPGISPIVYSRYLMENTVFLSLYDMAKDLPDYEEIPVACKMSESVEKEYRHMEDEFRTRAFALNCSDVRGISALARSLASVILLYSFILICSDNFNDNPDSHSSAADSFLLHFFKRPLTALEVFKYGILKISSAIKVSPIDKSVKNIILKII